MNPSPFGQKKGLMIGHNCQRSPGIAFGHAVVFSDGDRVQLNHEFAIVFPAMDVRRLMIPRVDPHVEAVIPENGWHCGIIIEPLGLCQTKPVCVRESQFIQANSP